MGKCHRILSSAVIVGIYISLAVLVFSFQNMLNPNKCLYLDSINITLPLVITFIIAVVVFQILLFYLLINPLRCEKDIKLADIFCCRLKNDLYKMVVRLAFCATICIFTTILMCVMILMASAKVLRISWVNVISLDLIVNTVSIMCSFKDWKKRLLPFGGASETVHRQREARNTTTSLPLSDV